MVGVYNRKLFRQNTARDRLKNLGGIMASSEELMQEALRTANAAPGPSDLGPMIFSQQQPAMSAPPMQPMQPMPYDPMAQQPMAQPMQPMPYDPMAQQPADPMAEQPVDAGMTDPMAEQPFMPPEMPQSALGYAKGGDVNPTADELERKRMAILAAAGAGGFVPPMDLADVSGPGQPSSPAPVYSGQMPEYDAMGNVTGGSTGFDIGAPAGSVTPAVSADEATAMADEAMKISETIDEDPPEVTADKIVTAATDMGLEPTGDQVTDLATVYTSITGKLPDFEQNIDNLNRGIIGAAIAAGTSARATLNIANGMLVGMQSAKETEERRAQAAQALQLAAVQAKNKTSGGSQNYDSPIDAYRQIYKGIMDKGIDEIDLPEGVTQEQYADDQARRALARMYTPDQLGGTMFEGLHQQLSTAGGGSGGQVVSPEVNAILEEARKALAAGKSRAAIEGRLTEMGIDPGLL